MVISLEPQTGVEVADRLIIRRPAPAHPGNLMVSARSRGRGLPAQVAWAYGALCGRGRPQMLIWRV
jgi:hypothetical protein